MTGKARIMAGVAAGTGALTLILYVALITGEGDDTLWEVAFWVLAMGSASTAAALGAATARPRIVFAGGVTFLMVGLPAIFSVGLPLIMAGAICVLALRSPVTRQTAS